MLTLLGYASGLAANEHGSGDAPLYVQKHPEWLGEVAHDWDTIVTPEPHFATIGETVADMCRRLANRAYELTRERTPFITIGGDHSCAIGTFSGVAAALGSDNPLGLIWIDAHMDAHTPETTKTGNLHGMPVAVLLGHGHPHLTRILTSFPKVLPEHLFLIGIRDYEAEEAALLQRLNVRVYGITEVKERGMSAILQEVLRFFRQQAIPYGITIDMDGIDPVEAPGVSTPVTGGIAAADLLEALSYLAAYPPLAAELTEYNPHHDQQGKTGQLLGQLAQVLVQVYS